MLDPNRADVRAVDPQINPDRYQLALFGGAHYFPPLNQNVRPTQNVQPVKNAQPTISSPRCSKG